MIEVGELTHDCWEEFADWFGSRGKAECWCMWPRLNRGTFRPGHPSNCDGMRRIVEAGSVPGLIARLDGEVVGWCAVGPRDDYPQYGETEPDPTAWAIACVFIDADVRGRGVARALIASAVSFGLGRGASAINGPPAWWLPGDAAAIRAATGAFLANGFVRAGPGARMPLLEHRGSKKEGLDSKRPPRTGRGPWDG